MMFRKRPKHAKLNSILGNFDDHIKCQGSVVSDLETSVSRQTCLGRDALLYPKPIFKKIRRTTRPSESATKNCTLRVTLSFNVQPFATNSPFFTTLHSCKQTAPDATTMIKRHRQSCVFAVSIGALAAYSHRRCI